MVRKIGNSAQRSSLQTFRIFSYRLIYRLADIDPLQRNSDIARRGLRRFHQILCKLFQPRRLADQHLRIFRRLSFQIFLTQQIHIIHDRSQRRFNVVRYVCNQLGLHPLTLHPLFDGDGHTSADVIEIFPVFAEFTSHIRGVHLCVQIAVCQRPSPFLQSAKHHADGHNHQKYRDIKQNSQKYEKSAAVPSQLASRKQIDHNDQNEDRSELPLDSNVSHGFSDPSPQRSKDLLARFSEDPRHPDQNTPDQAVSPPAAEFKSHGTTHRKKNAQQNLNDSYRCRCAENRISLRDRRISPRRNQSALGGSDIDSHCASEENKENQKEEIKRNSIRGGRCDTVSL